MTHKKRKIKDLAKKKDNFHDLLGKKILNK